MSERIPRTRIAVVIVVIASAFSALIWRVVDLHIMDHAFLARQGDLRTIREEVIPARRGMITDRRGTPLAVSAPAWDIWVDPLHARTDRAEWQQLCDELGLSCADVLARVVRAQSAGGRFLYLARAVPPSTKTKLDALDLDGVSARPVFKRFYPAGEVAAHVVGLTDIDENGQEGIELRLDDILKGHDGLRKILVDGRGRLVRPLSRVRPAEPGQDVRLSLDMRLQYQAYRELKAAVEAHAARSGSLVMLDVRTGEVLAMVNQPSFNPNNRQTMDPEGLRNRAVVDTFEPGSTVKPFTISAALNSGRFSLDSVVNTSPGYLRLNGNTIRDVHAYGEIDLATVIIKSSNVGASKVALALGIEPVWDMFYKVGFGQATGIELPGEAVGVLPSFPKWPRVRIAALSYGYGLSVTPLQLAHAYQVLANDGVATPVSILAGGTKGYSSRPVMPANVARAMRGVLARVVEKGGTGTRAALEAWRVAGKTGTVHRVGNNGYMDDNYISVFSGFAPVDAPRIATVVVIEGASKGEYYGGEVAAPVFRRVVGSALRILNVKPDGGTWMRVAQGGIP